MSWLFWSLIAFFALGAVLAAAQVGRPRKPMTGGEAAFIVLTNGLMILILVLGWPR